jgi:hypothetical protein
MRTQPAVARGGGGRLLNYVGHVTSEKVPLQGPIDIKTVKRG